MSIVMQTPFSSSSSTKPNGFTLLEVLVALVIFSIGLLGLASIQAVSLRNNQLAYMQTVAMQSAYDMADILRASADFQNNIDPSFDNVGTAIPSSAPATSCVAGSCTTSQMATFETYFWKHHLNDKLPCGRGSVERSGDIYTITILWDEDRVVEPGDCDTSIALLKSFTLNLRI